MTGTTLLYIVIAIVISFAMAFFMYGYKSKQKPSLKYTLFALRFITILSILLLLINPKLKNKFYTIVKPKLSVLVDNSTSIQEFEENDNVLALVELIKKNEALNKRFDISFFSFGSDFGKMDTISFSEKNTNIANAIVSSDRLFDEEIAPSILITDGNQTFGSDYEFVSAKIKNPIYPLVVGDSTTHTDLRIESVNANRYVFLQNEFPVEVLVNYEGKENITSRFEVRQGSATVFSKNLSFSNGNNSQTLNITLPANRIGLQKYSAEIIPLINERNKVNNKTQFAVEIIDQATNVLLVSEIVHPDLGALKNAITSNKQRTLTIKKPTEALLALNDYQLIILYQPTRKFDEIFKLITKLKKNNFIISGTQTDWNFLNAAQNKFSKKSIPQAEGIGGVLNKNFNPYIVKDLGFENFRPLSSSFGELVINAPNEVLLNQQISGFDTGNPLLATIEVNGERTAILDAENIWKWRAQSFLETNNFEKFDAFVGNLVQYLASNKKRDRLEIFSENFYYSNNPINVTAQYFDKNFVFDDRVSLSISIKNEDTNRTSTVPMLLKNSFFEADLSNLEPGNYTFMIKVANENISKSGSFSILEYNVEQQFLNANFKKLDNLAKNTGGKAYFTLEVERLFKQLLKDDRFNSIQKSETKTVPLVDWQYLLIIISFCLAAEWFIRKYNGLI